MLSEQLVPVVEWSSLTKKICLDLSTKRKTQISEKKSKKQRSNHDAGEIAGNVSEVIIEIPQKKVGEIAKNILEVIVEVSKEKVGEVEKTLELRAKIKKKFREIGRAHV